MQRPRRTSEFAEEGGTATKRPTRNRSYSMAPASASRPSVNLSASRRTATPQRLNTGGGSAHAPYTAEKRLNDKKWAQEQMHHIMEYLWDGGSAEVKSIVSELSNARGGIGLQMTTKHFVGIINYFLSFVVGNRFKVGTGNHVDDIIKIMPKLNYPYQLNKSWLKTPNTPHSFTHVVMLLDFLMEFAPPLHEEQMQVVMFPFLDIESASEGGNGAVKSEAYEHDEFKMPDTEYQAIFLAHAEEGFRLWDRQKDEEFQALQQQSTNLLIHKRCGMESLIALNAEIKRSRKQLKAIEQQRVCISSKELEQHQQTEEKYNRVVKELEASEEQYITNKEQLSQMKLQIQQRTQQVTTLLQDIAKLQANIKTQTLTIAQRDHMIEEIAQLKHILDCKVGSIHDLQGKSHHQEVIRSRVKKQLTTLVEKLNGYLREVFNYTGDLDKYLLPHNPAQKDIDHVICLLQQKLGTVKKNIIECEKQLQQLQMRIAELSLQITIKLEPKSITLQKSITAQYAAEQELLQYFKANIAKMDGLLLQLEQQLQKQNLEISSSKYHFGQQQEQLQALKMNNETTMSQAEQKQNTYLDKREVFLDQYEAQLTEAMAKLNAFEQAYEKL